MTCYRCGKEGHIVPQCMKKTSNGVGAPGKGVSVGAGGGAGGASSAALEGRVNICEVTGFRGELTQSGESNPFYFDNGAECSLVKLSIANRFSEVRSAINVRLTGVGNAHIYCTEQISCLVIIDDHCLHLSFLILPDERMPYEIMIGSDILNVRLIVNLSRARLSITKPVYYFSAIAEIDVRPIITDITPALRDNLVNLLTEFSFAFIDGPG